MFSLSDILGKCFWVKNRNGRNEIDLPFSRYKEVDFVKYPAKSWKDLFGY